ISDFAPLSLHDALPISKTVWRATTESAEICDRSVMMSSVRPSAKYCCSGSPPILTNGRTAIRTLVAGNGSSTAGDTFVDRSCPRSEEHTSELQSLRHLV